MSDSYRWVTGMEDLGGSLRRVYLYDEADDETYEKLIDVLEPDVEMRGRKVSVVSAALATLMLEAMERHGGDV